MWALATAMALPALAVAQHDHDEDEEGSVSTVNAYSYTIIATVLVSVISLLGVVLLASSKDTLDKWLFPLLGLSVGTLLGNSFFQLLPEVAKELPDGMDEKAGAVILGGVAFGYITEVLLHHHHHIEEVEEVVEKELNIMVHGAEETISDGSEEQEQKPIAKHPRHHIAVASLVGDLVHNFVDGLLIGATFLTSTSTGITTSIAIALHEIPQEVGDFCVLIHSGMSKTQALLLNLLVALSAVVGGVIAVALGTSGSAELEEASLHALPFAVGLFLYLSLGALGPEISKEKNRNKRYSAFAGVVIGIGLMASLLALPFEGHEHGGADGHDH